MKIKGVDKTNTQESKWARKPIKTEVHEGGIPKDNYFNNDYKIKNQMRLSICDDNCGCADRKGAQTRLV